MEGTIFSKTANFFSGLLGKSEPQEIRVMEKPQPHARFEGQGTFLFAVSFNGEKNLGEIGPIKNYRPDYNLLRIRSWQSYYESEISQTIVNKYTGWVIGEGLKMQSIPIREILDSNGIKFDYHEFTQKVEGYYNAFKKSKISDYSKMKSLNLLSNRCFRDSLLGGDTLVILRYKNSCVNVQLVDGANVQSPNYGTEYFPNVLPSGNRIINGVEYSPSGEHVAYYVRVDPIIEPYKFERILAKSPSSGLTMAYLVYGSEYRLDNKRGVPVLSTILETLKKLERYKEAMVGSAEETAKIAYQIVHQVFSTGESPLATQMAKAYNYRPGMDSGEIPIDIQGKQLADTVAATTNKQAYNMPLGAEIKTIDHKNQTYFSDFYNIHIDLNCACLGIPPEVAMSKYDSNFSASRAALKDWEHTLKVRRNKFAFEFERPIYDLWLYTEILKNNIQAPGYLKAKDTDNYMVLEAYHSARWIGATVPHIDPLKEVKAEREKLGAAGINLPLTTLEQATEALNGGESDSNMEQFAEELKESIKQGVSISPKDQLASKKAEPNVPVD